MHSYVDYFLSVEGGKLHGNKRCSPVFSVKSMTVCERSENAGKSKLSRGHSSIYR